MIPRVAVKRRRSKPRRVSVNRNRAYLNFLKEEGKCSVRGLVDECEGPIDPCHGPVAGIGYKGPDNEALPLCRRHHQTQHRLTWPNFELKYGIDRKHEAAAWFLLFQIATKGATE